MTAHAAIPPLGWIVFVELPMREALAPLYTSVLRNNALFAVAIGLATLAALFLARRMVGPIGLLQASAARVGAGELDRRIASASPSRHGFAQCRRAAATPSDYGRKHARRLCKRVGDKS